MQLLAVRNKTILAGEHPFWNRAVSNTSGEKFLDLYSVEQRKRVFFKWLVLGKGMSRRTAQTMQFQ